MSRLKEGRYTPLQQYLIDLSADKVRLSFEEIETILKAPLPASAYKYKVWWANSERSQPHAITWLKAGYKIKEVDFGNYVIFMKANVEEITDTVKIDYSNQNQAIGNTESGYIDKISKKLLKVRAFLNSTNLEGFSQAEVMMQFELLKGLRRLLGNVDNDMSFLGCLLIKEFLQGRHNLPDLNMALKAQGSPGLDVDEMTVDGKRIIGELKTTYPYKESDLGAQQKSSFLKDFEKLQRNEAEYKYFFVTELKTYEIICNKYYQHLLGVQIILLPEALQNSKFVYYVKEN